MSLKPRWASERRKPRWAAAYQLLADKKARGIYFALPTQATSNRMHRRMAEFVRRIAPTTVASRIIHGNSWLLEPRTWFFTGRQRKTGCK